MNTPPTLENIRPIQEKLDEATEKIYEAIELVVQLKLHPRHLKSVVDVTAYINEVTQKLLQATQGRPNGLVAYDCSKTPSPEEIEEIKKRFAEFTNRPITSNYISGIDHP